MFDKICCFLVKLAIYIPNASEFADKHVCEEKFNQMKKQYSHSYLTSYKNYQTSKSMSYNHKTFRKKGKRVILNQNIGKSPSYLYLDS